MRRDTLYQQLVIPMTGGQHRTLSGGAVNRVLRNLEAIRVFNLGLKVRNPLGRTESYQQRSGIQVDRSVRDVDGRRFDRGHIFATAIENGEPVTIGLSTASRIWQNTYLQIPQIIELCDRLAEKIANRGAVFTRTGLDLLAPGDELDVVPDGLVFAIWAEESYLEPLMVIYPDEDGVLVRRLILDFDLRVIESCQGECLFEVSDGTAVWRGQYRIGAGVLIAAAPGNAREFFVEEGGEALSIGDYLAEHPPTFYRADLSRVEGTSLFPNRIVTPFAEDRIGHIDWRAEGVDIESEKDDTPQGRSIFSWAMGYLRGLEDGFIFCDDESGEVADFISVNFAGQTPRVRFLHCKASSQAQAGSRQKDFHELCSQALRTSVWFNMPDLVQRLQYRMNNTGVVGLLSGDENEWRLLQQAGFGLRAKFEVTLVQPGLAHDQISMQIREILAGVEGHLMDAGSEPLQIIAS
jgi:hypothetical protein